MSVPFIPMAAEMMMVRGAAAESRWARPTSSSPS